MNIYIMQKEGNDEADFFESEGTLEQTLDQALRCDLWMAPLFRSDSLRYWVIENTFWHSDKMHEFKANYQWKVGVADTGHSTPWRGRYRLWRWAEFGCAQDGLSGEKWIRSHAKEIKLESAKKGD